MIIKLVTGPVSVYRSNILPTLIHLCRKVRWYTLHMYHVKNIKIYTSSKFAFIGFCGIFLHVEETFLTWIDSGVGLHQDGSQERINQSTMRANVCHDFYISYIIFTLNKWREAIIFWLFLGIFFHRVGDRAGWDKHY